MKIVFLAFLATFPAYANLPSQDADAARLQREFLAAHTPSVAELNLGKVWACDGFNTVKDQPTRFAGSSYRFEERRSGLDTYYLDMFAYELVQNRSFDANEISFLYRFASGHFMGNPYEDPSVTRVHSYLRVTADQRLLVEIDSFLYPDLPDSTRSQRIDRTVPGSLYPELRLMGFEECRITP